jgi:hypothetical protein
MRVAADLYVPTLMSLSLHVRLAVKAIPVFLLTPGP